MQDERVSILVMNEQQERKNPFFLPYDTPHDVAPFDRIRLEDFEEAMLEGIRRDDKQDFLITGRGNDVKFYCDDGRWGDTVKGIIRYYFETGAFH